MGETTKKASKTGFFKGLKSEFKKVVWPDKTTICKQTVAVVLISAVLGALIKVIDMLVQIGLDFIIG
ncbi:MAG: preprotein translocase subunit SecE [Lachnospiraceae bacterium]|nr:preprotein translocase subunit SecE [Lachnospiraceae bacterium]